MRFRIKAGGPAARSEQTPDGADDFYATMADEAAAFQEQEEAEWIAGSNFLDEFMP